MKIKIDTIKINCHFFSREEIELDIDPREVTTQEQVNKILTFMLHVSELLKKKVILTPENTPDIPLVEAGYDGTVKLV